ncbi:MAG: 23S rRNA (adenine(1618)-N(6))-methyltransferase RlmF [Bacteroidia bacterium]|nr:23S rRNA (adenine(1618)-N(6))-methyltransferase RlmF [Bacteroidia bacterium]
MPLKNELHPRNAHNNRYDFALLIAACPELKTVVTINKYGDESIDFSNPKAVKLLNKALLKQYYNISDWDIPAGYLCPPIPGRVDYVHYLADLIAKYNEGVIPRGKKVVGVDVGVGANCIYPILGHQLFGWDFLATDIDDKALNNVQKIMDNNKSLQTSITLLKQTNYNNLLKGVIGKDVMFDFTICNPPFHASAEEAKQASTRKVSNLKGKRINKPILNFGGNNLELWCEGGEEGFISKLANESAAYGQQCFWFTSLVSKQTTLPVITKILNQLKATEIKVIEMAQGQKISRFIAWTFLNPTQQKAWMDKRWK